MPQSAVVGLALAASLLHGCAPAPCAEVVRSGDPHDRLVQALDVLAPFRGPSAITVARQVGDGPVESVTVGCADVESRRPAGVDDLFNAGSTTKMVVAALAVDTLGTTAPLSTWGQWITATDPTIAELLQHRSGIPEYADDAFLQEAITGRTWTSEELVALAVANGAPGAPGATWAYSNTNYVLVGLALEAALGVDLATGFHARFPDTGMVLAHREAATRTRAVPTAEQCVLWSCVASNVDAIDPTGYDASGSLQASAPDLARFTHSLYRGELVDTTPMVQLMDTSDAFQSIGFVEYGMGTIGFETAAGRWLGHGGNVLGGTSLSAWNEAADTTITVMTNTSQGDAFFVAVLDLLPEALP